VGVVQGAVGARPVFLVWLGGGPHLRVAGHELELALALVLGVGAAGLALDVRQLVQCANAPQRQDAGVQESPEQRRLRFVALRDEEKRRQRNGCIERAAERAGVSVYAFKQVVNRKPKPTSVTQQMAAALTVAPVSAGRKTRA
jgi:hypothetical protein